MNILFSGMLSYMYFESEYSKYSYTMIYSHLHLLFPIVRFLIMFTQVSMSDIPNIIISKYDQELFFNKSNSNIISHLFTVHIT